MKNTKKMLLLLTMIIAICAVGCAKDEKKNGDSTKAQKTNNSQEKQDESKPVDYKGKTLADVIGDGYYFRGCMSSNNVTILSVTSKTNSAPEVTELMENIKGKTVAQMVDEYDISINHRGDSDENSFTASIGGVEIEFQLDNGVETTKKYEEDVFFDLEEADEVQEDVLNNIKVTEITYTIKLDEESNKLLNEHGDMDMDYIKDNADKMVISDMYIEIEPEVIMVN